MRIPITVLTVMLLSANSAPAQAKKEPLVAQVKASIDKGVRYLKENQNANGSWEGSEAVGNEGGWTSLAVLALLNSGVPVDNLTVAAGLKYLRGIESPKTYVRALQTMVFVEAGLPEDLLRIQVNVKWLIDARIMKAGRLEGWTYSKPPPGNSDNSNTQYALLGLWAGKQAGIAIDREVWESIREYYLSTQEKEGSWLYSNSNKFNGPNVPSLTMTNAGLCGLLIAGMQLNVGREIIRDGKAENCGIYEDNKNLATARAMNWIGRQFSISGRDVAGRVFYNLYGIERTGRLSGQRFLGGHDWYREGCQYLVDQQHENGSWYLPRAGWDSFQPVSTSFALLFLSKGRTPVLISKLVHGPILNRDADTDWNNDRNDLRHLVAFAGTELFRKLPLAWQTFDIQKATLEGEDEALADLLQSPIVYFNGHKSPLHRFTPVEKTILKRYIDNGGFIVAEACCGSGKFDDGFRDLVGQLWPDNELTELNADHPVWNTRFLVRPGDPYKLYGLSLGCKTVLIYSPKDLSCQWESNNFKDGRGVTAFRLGANIVAYATGLQPPKPRLTEVSVASSKEAITKRGFMRVAQIRHRGDWQPAPRAMVNLMSEMQNTAGIDVSLKPQEISIDNQNIVDFKFLYMHGRNDFHFDEQDLKDSKLRFNLETGGLLFADACCGSEAFDKAFRKFVAELFPKEKLEQVPPGDLLFSKKVNGVVALDSTNIKARRVKSGLMENVVPFLEGIKINGRWVVLYSKYDIGCALERHQSLDCRGYSPESAMLLAGAAVRYLLWPEDR